MSNRIKTRITRLEQKLSIPKKRRWVRSFSKQNGLDGEAIREEPDEQVIAHHLAAHPEDLGLEFDIINIVCVSPKGMDSNGQPVW